MPTSQSRVADRVDATAPECASGVGNEEYRSALRRHPAGVTVVTLDAGNGPVGFTATSFSSLSLNPPLVSFNITHTSSSIEAVHSADSLVVHLLSEDQQHLAQRFARSATSVSPTVRCGGRLETGEPTLHDTPVRLRLLVHQLIPVGDSTLVVGLVTGTHVNDTESPAGPLLYHDGVYHRPTPLDTTS